MTMLFINTAGVARSPFNVIDDVTDFRRVVSCRRTLSAAIGILHVLWFYGKCSMISCLCECEFAGAECVYTVLRLADRDRSNVRMKDERNAAKQTY